MINVPPYAKILVSKNGGATASGGVTCAFSDSIQLSAQNTASWGSALWEIYDYPPGFACPAGWSTDPASGWYYFAPSNPTTLPPAFTLPASDQNNWGPFALRLRLNGNPLARNPDGSPTVGFVQQLTDESTILKVPSPVLGLPGLAINETFQFDALKSWVGVIMKMLRLLDFFGIGGASGQAPYVIDSASPTLVAGDCVCQVGGNKITKALPTPLAAAGAVLGIVAAGGAPGATVGVYVDTVAPASITGLAVAGPVRVSTTARCEHVASYSIGDCPVGNSDSSGNVTLVRGPIVGLAPTGSAGGALGGTYPNPTIALAANSGITGVLDGSKVGTGGALGGASMAASTIALGANASLTGKLELSKQTSPTTTGVQSVPTVTTSGAFDAACIPVNGANGVAGTDASSKVALANTYNALIESKGVKDSTAWNTSKDSFTTTSYVDSGTYTLTFTSALAIGDIVEAEFSGFMTVGGTVDGRLAMGVSDNGTIVNELGFLWDTAAANNSPVSSNFRYVVTATNAINTFKVVVRGMRISGSGNVNLQSQGSLKARVIRP